MRLDASPWADPLWGWRWMARWYAGAALFGAFAFTVFGGSPPLQPFVFGPAWVGRNQPPDAVVLLCDGQAPRVDAATGLAVVPVVDCARETLARFDAGLRARLASDEPAGPRFLDRTLNPARIARQFDAKGGVDVGDGSSPFVVGGRFVVVETYRLKCSAGVPDTLRAGGRDVAIHGRFLRVVDARGQRVRPLVPPLGRWYSWFPHARSMRVLVGDEGRTLWCRVTDVDGGRWIVSVDLVTGTTLQIDADPGG